MYNIEDLFDEFLNYLKAEKNASKSTITSYSTDFFVFLTFLKNNKITLDVEKIRTPDLRRYITHLKIEKKYKVRTIRRKIHSLSSFFKYLLEMEYIMKNPMLPIHAPKEPDQVPIFIAEEDLKKLVNAPMKYKSETSLQDKVILEMLIFTGVRRSELLSLNWEDVDFKNNTLTVKKGKGNKERIIPLLSPLDEDLWNYLQTRLPLKNNAIFISSTGNRLSITGLQTLFRKYIKLSGLEGKGYTIHKCRHSFATLLIQNGADLLSVQKLLGHEDLNTTKVYTHLDMNHLSKAIKKFPLSLK